MKMATAYTAFLFQFPAFVVGTLSAVAGFLGASLPGLGFDRVDACSLALDSGIQWGRTIGSLMVLGIGLLWLLGLRLGQLTGARFRVACAFSMSAVVGPAGALLGASLGTGLACGTPFFNMTAAAIPRAAATWPLVFSTAAMISALALRELTADRARSSRPRA
jgi:hypothetical protein